jgi:hypothetical protein
MARSTLGILLINALFNPLVSCGSIHDSRRFAAATASRIDQPEASETPPIQTTDISCTPDEMNETGECPSPFAPKFTPGDIIELYNVDSPDIQIVFPSIVNGRVVSSEGTTYHITKTTDGRVVNSIPERHVHHYKPYEIGSDALCNVGEFTPPDKPSSVRSRPIIFQCTVLGYEPAAETGAMMLQGTYEVKVKDTRMNEEYVTSVPVWKMQRHYLASAQSKK